MKMLTEEIISTCVCVWLYVHTCIYAYTFCSNCPQKIDGDFCINPCCWMRHICFMPPSHLFPALPHLFSGAPLPQLSCPALPHTGWPFWSGDLEKGALSDTASSTVLTECILFPIRVVSPVANELPRERRQRSGVYRMSVFKVTLCVSHFFFLIKKKSTVFWWWINNTKRTLVNREEKFKE